MEISQVVRIRRARWRVIDVRSYTTCRLVTAVCLESRCHKRRGRFLIPFDIIEPLERSTRPLQVGLRRWRVACRRLITDAAPPGSSRVALGARIDLMPYQLEPAMAVLRGAGTRILLADEVGLGKTIQAGLIIAELHARGYADRVLVLVPAGLREQWDEELRRRYGLDMTVADAQTLRRIAADLPVGMNPWAAAPMAIASIDYAKRPEVLPALQACRWDIVVIDEAHGIVGDTERHAAARTITASAAYVLLVTATPHSGDEVAFRSLCDLGRLEEEPLLVFRRPRATSSVAAPRRVHTLSVRTSDAEARMHAMLARYTDAVRAEHGNRCLALAVLHKRAFSGCWALAASVARRIGMLDVADTRADQLALPLRGPDPEATDEDLPPVWPTDLALADPNREHRLLTALLEMARAADQHDSKIQALQRLLGRIGESIIVFTEYRDTLERLRLRVHRPVIVLHGGLGRDERARVVREFTARPGMILFATDAAGQGLNLHQHCRLVVSLELPWNPVRLEQRIGRVDRIGQVRRVHAIHFVGAATNEQRVLARLRARIARAGIAIDTSDPFGAPFRDSSNDSFGTDEEAIAAQLVLLGQDSDNSDPSAQCGSRLGPAGPTGTSAERLTVDLRAGAESDSRRLAAARRFSTPSDGIELGARAPLVARTRRWRSRAALNGRHLQIWSVAAVDGAGTVIESCVIGALVEPAIAVEEVRTTIGQSAERWRQATGWTTAPFWAARLDRERRITANAPGPPEELFQPGLFDHRANRAREEDTAVRAQSILETRARLAALEDRCRLQFRLPELLLVLTS